MIPRNSVCMLRGKRNKVKKINLWITGLTAFVFLFTQTDVMFASVLFVSESSQTAVSESLQNHLENLNLNSSAQANPKKEMSYSVFDYDASTGELSSMKQFEVGSSGADLAQAANDYLANEVHFDARGQVEYVMDYNQQGIEGRQDFIYGPEKELLRIDLRKADAPSAMIDSSTSFEGPQGKERPVKLVNFDDEGDVTAVNYFTYNNRTGALLRIDHKRSGEVYAPMVTSTFFAGEAGKEAAVKILTYDRTGSRVVNRIDCAYSGKALREVAQRRGDDINLPIYSKTVFTGSAGEEKQISQLHYDEDGSLLYQTRFVYDSQGALIHSETREANDSAADAPFNRTDFKNDLPVKLVLLNAATGKPLSTSEMIYDSSRALKQMNVRDGGDHAPIHMSTFFEGETGDTRIHYSITYTDEGKFQYRHDYLYGASGALTQIQTKLLNDIAAPVTSMLYFRGQEGAEVPSYALTYDASGQVLTSRIFNFDSRTHLKQAASSDSQKDAAAIPAFGGNSGNPGSQNLLYSLNEGAQQLSLGKNASAYNPQGIMSPIIVRAGPEGNLSTFELSFPPSFSSHLHIHQLKNISHCERNEAIPLCFPLIRDCFGTALPSLATTIREGRVQ